MLTEDSVIDWMSGGLNCLPNYRFDHMLRGAITGNNAAGFLMTSGSVSQAQVINNAFTGFPISQRWNPAHLNVIAFVSNNDTKEVLQAELVSMQ